MADFHQPGAVATFHRLTPERTRALEEELQAWARIRPIGLVLPALYCEFEHPAMGRIVEQLAGASFLRRIVVALGRADERQYRNARRFFDDFEIPVTFLRVNHPAVEGLVAQLGQANFPPGTFPWHIDGKGRTCWLATGYLLAHGDCDVIVHHDCDIRNYSRGLVASLCYPVAQPELGYEFAKGYYARVAGRLFGRVTRLFVLPLVRALARQGIDSPLLRLIDDLRYPLSGEVALTAALAHRLPMPTDWGLEIGTLAEVRRLIAPSQMCQVEVAEVYEHKHKVLAPPDASQGLPRMASEVGTTLFRSLRQEGWPIGSTGSEALQAEYLDRARELLSRYRADARFNGLLFDEGAEHEALSLFASVIPDALLQAEACDAQLLPSWQQVRAAVPDAFEQLMTTVAATDSLSVRRPSRVPAASPGRRLVARGRRVLVPQPQPVLAAKDFA
jgi:glucosyl-3-phosphoglycerate synthase